jgi:predicted transcriptional regulator
VGFERGIESAPLALRVYNFLCSRKEACLREIAEAVGEDRDHVNNCLQRLWKRVFILRTRDAVYRYETAPEGRSGIVANTRAINYC